MIDIEEALAWVNDPILLPEEGMRRLLAIAWDEGYKEGADDEYQWERGRHFDAALNPYTDPPRPTPREEV